MSSRVWIAIALAACGTHDAPPSATPATPATPPPSGKPLVCKAAADEVGKFLTTMDHEGQLLDLRHVSPPLRRDLTIRGGELTSGPAIELRRDGTYYYGKLVEQGALAGKLEEAHRRIQQDIDSGRVPARVKIDPSYLIVVVDEKVPWGAVVTALDAAARAQLTHLTFVFRRPATTPPPPRTHVDDEIEKLVSAAEGGGNVASALADYFSPKVALCPPLATVFAEISNAEMDDRASYLLAHTAPALAECNCALDPAEARSMMWQFLGNQKPTVLLRVELDRKAKPLSAPADQPWGEASTKLTAGAHAIWLTATPARG